MQPRGHAIEFRINAEDPAHDFRPGRRHRRALPRARRPGDPDGLAPVPGLRGAARTTTRCSASSIVWGPDRATAIARGRAALDELVVDGIVTNLEIHQALISSETFLDGRMTTNLLDRVGSAAFLAAAART